MSAWPLVQDGLRGWLVAPRAHRRGDRAAVEGLFVGLTVVGLAMETARLVAPRLGRRSPDRASVGNGGSQPDGERVSHGACVAVGCVDSARALRLAADARPDPARRGAILARPRRCDDKAADRRRLRPTGEIADRALDETPAKHVARRPMRARLARSRAVWPEPSGAAAGAGDARRRMRAPPAAAGAPTEAAEIGVDPTTCAAPSCKARFLRSRYTRA